VIRRGCCSLSRAVAQLPLGAFMRTYLEYGAAHYVASRSYVSSPVRLVNDFGAFHLQTLKTSPHLSNLIG
jgi:hypothetical protein